MHTNFWSENPKRDLGVDGRIILIWILKKEGVRDWTHPVQDRNRSRAVVNTIMNLRFS
jgi:hypothetical protein